MSRAQEMDDIGGHMLDMENQWVPSQVRCPACPTLAALHDPTDMIGGLCASCAEAVDGFWTCTDCEGDGTARSLWGYPIPGDKCETCGGSGRL